MKINKVFEDAVTIVTSSSWMFLPYTGVMIRSITDHRDAGRSYDILVIVSARDKAIENKILKENCFENVSIRFFLASDLLPELPCFTYGHFSKETYYKLFIPFIADAYEKVLFLDGDMIVCRDIALLYDVKMEKELVCAALDADTAGLYNGAQKNKKEYMDMVLKLKNPYGYFQAGAVVFNIPVWKEHGFTMDGMAAMVSSRRWQLLDQDILNVLCEHQVKYVSMRWNVLADFNKVRIQKNIAKAPKNLQKEYFFARKQPYIIHFAGPDKPWSDPEMDFAAWFWECAKHTSLYEIILYRKIEEMKLENRLRTIIRNKIQHLPVMHFAGRYINERERKWRSDITLPTIKRIYIKYKLRKSATWNLRKKNG